jgi:hypothetical protein
MFALCALSFFWERGGGGGGRRDLLIPTVRVVDPPINGRKDTTK